MAANQYTTERVRRLAAMPPADRCYVCNGLAKPSGFGIHRGESFMVCLRCVLRYDGAVNQIERYGRRFRFIERAEIPHQDTLGIDETLGFSPNRPFREIYKLLLLLKERQKIRQKEVNWMVEDTTRKILKFIPRVATILKDTYSVRGDDFKLSDDIALQKIRDLIDEIDPNIMTKAKKKRLT